MGELRLKTAEHRAKNRLSEKGREERERDRGENVQRHWDQTTCSPAKKNSLTAATQQENQEEKERADREGWREDGRGRSAQKEGRMEKPV